MESPMERDTQQRRAIRRALREAGRPLSHPEILTEASREAPGLGTATVYRTVKALVEARWLAVVSLPGEPPRYELAGKGHHHHFHCRGCGRMYEIDGCPDGLPQMTPSGFRLESHELLLYGRCSTCAA
jgi:Fur family transcriptional regulator, ferric uptake regulator